MAAVIEILPMTRYTANSGSTEYIQPVETVVDVASYTEGAIILTVASLNRNAGTMSIWLQTAIDNLNEQYYNLHELVEHAADPGSYPDKKYAYLAGTSNSNEKSGFARYLRIWIVNTQADWNVVLGCKAVLKP